MRFVLDRETYRPPRDDGDCDRRAYPACLHDFSLFLRRNSGVEIRDLKAVAVKRHSAHDLSSRRYFIVIARDPTECILWYHRYLFDYAFWSEARLSLVYGFQELPSSSRILLRYSILISKPFC